MRTPPGAAFVAPITTAIAADGRRLFDDRHASPLGCGVFGHSGAEWSRLPDPELLTETRLGKEVLAIVEGTGSIDRL